MHDLNQPVRVLLCDARYRAGCRQQNNIRTGCHEGLGVGGGHDFLPALPCYTGCMHLAGGQQHAVTDGGRNRFQRFYDQFIADAVAGVAGQNDQINAHFGGPACIFYGGQASAAHFPERSIVAFGGLQVAGLQVDAHDAPGQTLELPHGLDFGNLRQCVNDRVLHVKHIQQQNVSTQGGRILRIRYVHQQRRRQADGLARQYAALTARNRVQQLRLGVPGQLAGGAVQQTLYAHSSSSSSITRPMPLR